jgi:hypothetical protein
MEQESECYFYCPYCWQKISFIIETTAGSQKYIEDCEVCCQPIEVEYIVEDGEIISLETEKAN